MAVKTILSPSDLHIKDLNKLLNARKLLEWNIYYMYIICTINELLILASLSFSFGLDSVHSDLDATNTPPQKKIFVFLKNCFT